MKILVVGRFYEEGVASFIAEHLEELGHRVARHDPGPRLAAFGSRAAFYWNRGVAIAGQTIKVARRSLGLGDEGALRRAIEIAVPIDLTLVTHDFLTPAQARLVKSMTKAPLALWYPDPIWSFQRHMFLNAPYDILFFKDPYLVDMFRRKLRAPVFYMPECFSPRSLSKAPDTIAPCYTADICTAGNLYAYRVAFFRQLAEYDIKIWGPPPPFWMDLGPVKPMVQNKFVAHSDKVQAFRGAKIVLNNLNPAEIWGTNVRTFEICGAGGFQIVDWRPALSQLFDIGRELVAFENIDDLEPKLRHFLGAPDEREAIAEAGRLRAHRDHTYSIRLALLLDTIAGRAGGHETPQINPSELLRP